MHELLGRFYLRDWNSVCCYQDLLTLKISPQLLAWCMMHRWHHRYYLKRPSAGNWLGVLTWGSPWRPVCTCCGDLKRGHFFGFGSIALLREIWFSTRTWVCWAAQRHWLGMRRHLRDDGFCKTPFPRNAWGSVSKFSINKRLQIHTVAAIGWPLNIGQ